MSRQRDVESTSRPMVVAGVLIVLASIVGIGLAFYEGDIVLALALPLLAATGLLYIDIGRSPSGRAS
ncbi:hypothetical protein [Halomicrococcus gelatinilyticus]|uniref:hypothetical protein n=1 Tax=Halomicrococcus gelatinilyticus TaxID=1702103 RepID=UPI002E10E645